MTARHAGSAACRGHGAILPMLSAMLLVVCGGPLSAAGLGDRIRSLEPPIDAGAFGIPLRLSSVQKEDRLTGEVLAVVPYSLATIRTTLDHPDAWCAAMILHPNVKSCGYAADGTRLEIGMGRKAAPADSDTRTMAFSFRTVRNSNTSLLVVLAADSGPLGTRDYRLEFEAAAADADRSYVRLSYAYEYGASARLATAAYLRTIGRDKVGFTIVGAGTDGEPEYVGGVRGILERNTMRYYLAVDTLLATAGDSAADEEARRQRRYEAWYAAIRQYPRQLRELSREEYLQSKETERPFILSESTDSR